MNFEDMSIEQLKQLRKEYCGRRSTISNILDREAYGRASNDSDALIAEDEELEVLIAKVTDAIDKKENILKR